MFKITCMSIDSYAYIWVYLHVQIKLRRTVHACVGHYVCTFGHSTEQNRVVGLAAVDAN